MLEDLHWADNLSLDLLTLLMEVLPHYPLLLLCLYRPEREHRCWQLATLATAKCSDHFSEVRLRELTAQQSQQLVDAIVTGLLHSVTKIQNPAGNHYRVVWMALHEGIEHFG